MMFAKIPIKFVSHCNAEVLPEGMDPLYEILYVDIGNVGSDGSMTSEQMLFGEAPSRARRVVRHGDVIVSTVRTYLRAIAHVENPPDNMVVSTGFAVLRPFDAAESRFFGYALQSNSFVDEVVARSRGVSYPAIAPQELTGIKVPIPPRDIQLEIANFLDRETDQSNALISDYERFIELLEEKRTALITKAVTKGLEPDIPMKDSGLVGVGAIPAHWGTAAIWMLFEIGRGRVISHEYIASHTGMYPVFSSQTENDGEMGAIDTFDFDGHFLTWTTDGAKAGTVFERYGRFNCTNVCGTLKSRNEELQLSYFRHVIGLASKYFVRLDINPKLMNDVMAKMRVPLPPPAEQRQIVELLNRTLPCIEALIADARDAIMLVKERRNCLITAAVTGKIDINTYKSQLTNTEVA